MNGVRFYQDGNGKIKRRGWKKLFPEGFNGLAVFPEHKLPTSPGCIEATGSLYAEAGDGPYCGTSVHVTYLDKDCRRISEAEARKLFPNLIKYLEG